MPDLLKVGDRVSLTLCTGTMLHPTGWNTKYGVVVEVDVLDPPHSNCTVRVKWSDGNTHHSDPTALRVHHA